MGNRKSKSKPSGLRQYWPHLTLKQCEEERQKLFDAQEGKCAICGKPESYFSRRLAVDHSHVTGKVRGLLCYHDNKFVVGRFDINKAVKMISYLIKYDNPHADTAKLRQLQQLIKDTVGT